MKMRFQYNFKNPDSDDKVNAAINKAHLLRELQLRTDQSIKWTPNELLDLILAIRKADFPQDIGILRHPYRKGVQE